MCILDLDLAFFPAWKPLQIYPQLQVYYTNLALYVVQKWNEINRYIIPNNEIISLSSEIHSREWLVIFSVGFSFVSFSTRYLLSNFRIQETFFYKSHENSLRIQTKTNNETGGTISQLLDIQPRRCLQVNGLWQPEDTNWTCSMLQLVMWNMITNCCLKLKTMLALWTVFHELLSKKNVLVFILVYR